MGCEADGSGRGRAGVTGHRLGVPHRIRVGASGPRASTHARAPGAASPPMIPLPAAPVWTALLLTLAVAGCGRGEPSDAPARQPARTSEQQVGPASESASLPMGQLASADAALLALTRNGNILVRDLLTGDEHQLTTDGAMPPRDDDQVWYPGKPGRFVGARLYREPVIASPAELYCLRFVGDPCSARAEHSLLRFSLAGGAASPSRVAEHVVALGLEPGNGRLLVLQMGGSDRAERIATHPPPESAPLDGIPCRLAAIGGPHGRPVPRIEERFCSFDPDAIAISIQASTELGAIATPRFPTDYSSSHRLRSWPAGEPFHCLDGLSRDFPMGLQDVALTASTAYGTFPMGLCTIDLTGASEPRVLARLPAAVVPGRLTVSEALGVAVVSGYVGGGRPKLWLVDLTTSETRYLCEGDEPDVWPK